LAQSSSAPAATPTGPATIVTLAPGLAGTLVTSERAVVEAVHPVEGTLDIRTSDGRNLRLSGAEANADRLGYGYATTVHRSQGATVARAHLFADGGDASSPMWP
jgi:ATP-dependent exoDNAse (exonuclease V) alpha subunit